MPANAENRSILPLLLSLTAGYVDTAGFLAPQGLFTAHVTSNFVTLGASLVFGTSGAIAKLLALLVLRCGNHGKAFHHTAVETHACRIRNHDRPQDHLTDCGGCARGTVPAARPIAPPSSSCSPT
jgi:hypothetical protein